MGEMLSIEEIYNRFPSEWVLVEDPDVDEVLQVKRGKVLFHSADRDEFYQTLGEVPWKSAAIVYTGPMPENVVLAL